jgi:hypothetical protein
VWSGDGVVAAVELNGLIRYMGSLSARMGFLRIFSSIFFFQKLVLVGESRI